MCQIQQQYQYEAWDLCVDWHKVDSQLQFLYVTGILTSLRVQMYVYYFGATAQTQTNKEINSVAFSSQVNCTD